MFRALVFFNRNIYLAKRSDSANCYERKQAVREQKQTAKECFDALMNLFDNKSYFPKNLLVLLSILLNITDFLC